MRLVTRGDLDGLACAVLLSETSEIEDVVLEHPQAIIAQTTEVQPGDVVANLPYAPGCSAWFDHKPLGAADPRPPDDLPGVWREADSAAQLVWEHVGRPARWRKMVGEVNRLDAGRLTADDIDHPSGWVLLGFTLDGRSGLGAFRHYFSSCLAEVRSHGVEEVLRKPMVQTRVAQLSRDADRSREVLRARSVQRGALLITDLRRELSAPVCNRFLVYTLFPRAHYALRLHWGPRRDSVILCLGRSILHRDRGQDLAELMARWGGGGLRSAASATVPTDLADGAVEEIAGALAGHRGAAASS